MSYKKSVQNVNLEVLKKMEREEVFKHTNVQCADINFKIKDEYKK